MNNFRYEELKEIRRGFGIVFVLVLTYLGDFLKGYVKTSSHTSEEKFLLIGTIIFLIALFLGLLLITVSIWKKGGKNG